MQLRIPGFAVLTSLAILTANDLVAAQNKVTVPECDASWKWSFNSLDQNACTVAAYLIGICAGASVTIPSLSPGEPFYAGPENANLCLCNTVAYNLLSACGACQGAGGMTWDQWSLNCTTKLTSAFAYPIPSETRVPHWALLDTTLPNANFWNVTDAIRAGDTPETLPGSLIGASASTSSASTSSSVVASSSSSSSSSSSVTSSPSSSPSPSSRSKSNTGAIAGGVGGGLVALVAICLLTYFLRKRRWAQAPSAEFMIDGATPSSDDEKTHVLGAPAIPMKLYNPNDPSTYPGYQSVPSTPDAHDSVTPNDGSLNGSTSAGMQNTRTQGYHGLPTV